MKAFFVEIFGGGMFSGVYDMLNVPLLSNAKYANAYTFVDTIYHNVMVPIALSLLIIYFVCGLIEKSTNEQFTYEQLFVMLAKMVVGVFLIAEGFEILVKFQEVGLNILTLVKETAEAKGLSLSPSVSGEEYINNSPGLKQLYKSYLGVDWPKEPGWMQIIKSISTIITLAVMWLVISIVKACVSFIVYMRVFEIYIRTMFTPIALSDVFYNGLNSTGFRFLKNYLAVSMQVVAIYVCMLLYNVISSDIALDTAGDIMANRSVFLVKYCAMSVAVAGILFKSQSLIKEFLGAN